MPSSFGHLGRQLAADAAAALAFRWAQNEGPRLFDTPQTGPAMQAMAERVMRAVQADPTLLERSLAGNAPSWRR